MALKSIGVSDSATRQPEHRLRGAAMQARRTVEAFRSLLFLFVVTEGLGLWVSGLGFMGGRYLGKLREPEGLGHISPLNPPPLGTL